MKRKLVAVFSIAIAFLAIFAATFSVNAQPTGVVYTMDNASEDNTIMIYSRGMDGSLTLVGNVSTQGMGTGDRLGSQGAVILSSNGEWLLAVNAGSNEITVFKVDEDNLTFVSKVDSMGTMPISLTMNGEMVYVLNAGGAGNMTTGGAAANQTQTSNQTQMPPSNQTGPTNQTTPSNVTQPSNQTQTPSNNQTQTPSGNQTQSTNQTQTTPTNTTQPTNQTQTTPTNLMPPSNQTSSNNVTQNQTQRPPTSQSPPPSNQTTPSNMTQPSNQTQTPSSNQTQQTNQTQTPPTNATQPTNQTQTPPTDGNGNIAGFMIDSMGNLTYIEGSSQPLSGAADASPEQIGFNPDGDMLVVAEKNSDMIDLYMVDQDGVASPPMMVNSTNPGPYAFAFTSNGILVMSEVTNNTCTSYAVYNGTGLLLMGNGANQTAANQTGTAPTNNMTTPNATSPTTTPNATSPTTTPNATSPTTTPNATSPNATMTLRIISGAMPTFGEAPCWLVITEDDMYAYTTNAASGTISTFMISDTGGLNLLSAIAAKTQTPALDMALSEGNMYLYVLNGDSITGFEVFPDGGLHQVTDVSGLPDSATGLAAK